MPAITDLDELLGADKKVKLKGKTYVLPPDLPAELYLRVQQLARDEVSEPEMIEELYKQLLELFRYKQPDLESLPLTLTQCVNGIGKIYGDGGGDEGNAPPPPPRTRGGRSSTKRRTS